MLTGMLELLVFLVITGVLPVIVNKSTESGRFDWIVPHLRTIWTVRLSFFSFYLLQKPSVVGVIVKLRDRFPGILGYIVCAAVGAVLLCGYWWFAGRAFPRKSIGAPENSPDFRIDVPHITAFHNAKHPQLPVILLLSIEIVNRGQSSIARNWRDIINLGKLKRIY